LQVKVPENQLPKVRLRTSARISSDADPRINVQGRVREISPLVDAQTRQAMIKIDLPTGSLLRPGMFLRAAITVQMADAMTVPAKAVLPQTDGRSIVYVLEGQDTVRAKRVDVGARQDSSNAEAATVEIKSGLNGDDRVVVAGAGYVKDGDRVTVVSN
jgi:HlyD family secretion protein